VFYYKMVKDTDLVKSVKCLTIDLVCRVQRDCTIWEGQM